MSDTNRRELVDDLLLIDDEFIKIAICHFSGTEDNVYPALNDRFGHSHQGRYQWSL